MGRIAILPDTVADQIAAGEVVERPASVVKELVENALDAGATDIVVSLEGGGRRRIDVTDDGSGMERDDAVLSVDRHATSKIHSAAELVGVATYGFRGEALAAIASVSSLAIETARVGEAMGTRVVVRGGRLEGVEPVARTAGTSVTVERLFFNTPARRKFLRAQQAETRAAGEAVTVLALARLDVSFRLESDGRVLLDAPRTTSTAERVAALFGPELARQLLAVEWRDGAMSVRGFIQRPADARPTGRKAYLFVNGRPFRDPFVVRAAEAGYRGAVHPGARPSVFLALELPGDAVDVNVHPQKLEVRFRDKFRIERGVEEAVRAALGGIGSAAEMGSGPAFRAASPAPWTDAAVETPGAGPHRLPDEAAASLFAPLEEAAPALGADVIQVFNTYLVMETPEGIAFIDQHSAHERVLYERAMAQLSSGASGAQHLLLPFTVNLEARELEAVEEHGPLLAAIGFEAEPFGGAAVAVHAVPNPHRRFDAERCFQEVVADLARGRFGGLHNRLERFAATYACRAAVKAGEHLEPEEIRELLRRLFACTLPPHDVHGRPTIVHLAKDELERRFGRS